MVNVLSSDILIADIHVSKPSPEQTEAMTDEQRSAHQIFNTMLDGLLEKYHAKHGDGIPLTQEEAQALLQASQNIEGTKVEPGGSSGNTFATLGRLMGYNVKTDYIGALGSDTNSRLIREDFKNVDVNILPAAEMPSAEPALSFVFNEMDGTYTRATYPGNADKLLKPDMVTDALVQKNDVVLLPGSLWNKLGHEFSDTLFNKALEQDKRIFLTLPKQADFGHPVSPGTYQRLIENADVIVGDEETLNDIYNTAGDFKRTAELLQRDLQKRDAIRQAQGKPNRNRNATAFIIRSDSSATLITAASPPGTFLPEPAQRHTFPPFKNSFGAHDAAYAGFLAGYISGFKPLESARFALEVADTKSEYGNSSRIPESVTVDPATKKQWSGFQQSLSGSLQNIGNAFSTALTGVSNVTDRGQRTKGMKVFDLFLYPILTNTAVFLLSVFVTHQTTYGNDNTFWGKALRARGDRSREWTAGKMQSLLGMEPKRAENTAKMSMMVLWSFLDGSLMAPVVAWIETKRNTISRWIDKRLGSTPDDPSVYDAQLKRDWKSIFLGRGATAAIVIPTAIALNQPRKGGQKSWNTVLFEDTGGKIGDSAPIKKLFPKLSQKTVTNDSGQKIPFLKAMGEISAFELFYTSVCTFGLWVGGMTFAKLLNKENKQKATNSPTQPAAEAQTDTTSSSAPTARDNKEPIAKDAQSTSDTSEKSVNIRMEKTNRLKPDKPADSFASKVEAQKEQAPHQSSVS